MTLAVTATRSSPHTEDDGFSITSSLSVPSSPASVMSAHRVHTKFYINDELTVFLVNNEVSRVSKAVCLVVDMHVGLVQSSPSRFGSRVRDISQLSNWDG
jgi:hypothetical protein